MLPARFRPIENWPGQKTPSHNRRGRGVFSASYTSTLDFLEKELGYLDAKEIIIEAYFPMNKIRNDGWPYSDASPTEPGVIVGFQSKLGPIRIHADSCWTYEHNLRAIAMHLHHLRMAGHYGVGKDAQQYRGWKQLPGPLITPAPMSLEEAARIVGKAGGVEGAERQTIEKRHTFEGLYRFAVKALHPDANSGKVSEGWNRLQEAAEMLKKHHGI